MDESLISLYEGVGSLLAGRRITLLPEDPPGEDAIGVFSRHGNTAYIRMRPNQPRFEGLLVFLHEVAHVKLHFKQLSSSRYHEVAPNSEEPTDDLSDAALVREKEADTLARKWIVHADLRRPEGMDVELGRLVALADYATGDFYERISERNSAD